MEKDVSLYKILRKNHEKEIRNIDEERTKII